MEQQASPFKFLDAYTREDRDIFFGRERETEEMYQKVFESKILLVYGISGTGKTSLINCGLANKFEESDWLPINIRRGRDINSSLEDELKKSSLTEIKNNSSVKKLVQSVYLDHFKPIYLIFDQFEEIFIFGNREERIEFIKTIHELVESDIQCKYLFSIREEYLAGVTEFESYIPEFLTNRMRIEKMTQQYARDVIEGPCIKNGIAVEDGFAESLLNKLNPATNEIELTYLQVFLDKIYKLSEESKQFSLQLIDKVGDVSDLLGSFLEEQISELDDPDKGLVVLKAFVSMQGTKKQIGEAEISEFTRTLGQALDPEELKDLLQRFVNLRVLKDKDEHDQYELRHDSLAVKIFEQITLVEKELLEVKNFMDNAFMNYERRGIHLSAADLKYIAPYEDKIFFSKKINQFIEISKKEILKVQRRRRTITAAAVILLFLVLTFFTGWAFRERGKAVDQSEIAEEQRQEAVTQRDLAMVAQAEADQARTEAVASKDEALIEKSNAETARQVAERQRQISVQERNRAEQLLVEANEQREIAQEAQLRAEESREKTLEANKLANFHLYIFNGKELANKSLMLQEDDSLKALLALTAYELINYGYGEFNPSGSEVEYDPEILKALQEAFYIFHRDSLYYGEVWGLDYKNDLLAFSNIPGRLIQANLQNDQATEIPVSKVLKNAVLSENSGITSLAIDQSAEKMVLGTINGTVLMYSVGDTTSKEIYHHDDRVISVDFIPEKNWLVSTSADRSIMLWDLNTSELIEKIRHPDIPLALEVLDSQNMITSNSKGDMFLWMLNDINTISNPGILYNAGNQPIHSLAYNAAHHLLVAGTEGNTLLFSYAVGETRMMVPVSFTMKHKGKVSKLEFSHDNRWLASAGWDGQIMLWDLKDMKIEEFERIVPVITENDQKIFSLCFDPNDDYLIFGDNVILHIKAININLAYGQLKHFVGDKTLNDQEWNYYIKGDLQRPSEDYTATTHGQ